MRKLKYLPAQNRLDQGAKEHDLHYANPNITTEEADEQFLEDSKGTGSVGGLARVAIRAKRALGLDDYFRGDIDGNQPDSIDSAGRSGGIQSMDTSEGGQQSLSVGGDGKSWTAAVIGQALPGPSSNFVQQHCFNRTFKNMIKTTDMHSVKCTFTRYENYTESSEYENLKSIGQYAWAQLESADYVVLYFLTSCVTSQKWEATIRLATSYRITKQGF